MTWENLLEKLQSAGLQPSEQIYVDNYGNTLPLEHPEFQGRYIRCARGVMDCRGLEIEAYVFSSETYLQEFMELIGVDPWWIACQNVVFHFPESDPAVIGSILHAISDTAD